MKTNIIFGPPGTGKTTTLLNLVDQHLKSGTDPASIGFVAFTRKAANEAKSRALSRLKISDDSLPWYRTLHSSAFRLLGLNRNQVMGPSDYITISRALGIYITVKRIDEDGSFAAMTKGDRLLFTENMARVRGITLEEMWSEYPNEDINWIELAQFRRVLMEYKERYAKLDFTDMIERTISQKLQMPVEIAFVDEAQDLSPIQWAAVDQLFGGVRQLFISGDDDQAIFKWAGADSGPLLNRQGERQVLPQSYRVPKKIQTLATTIIEHVDVRVHKTWSSTIETGSIEYCSSLDQLDMRKGSWLLLARNIVYLRIFTEYCLRNGLVFDAAADNPLRGDALRAILIWENLRKDRAVTATEAISVYDMMSANTGVRHGKKRTLEALRPDELVTMQDLKQNHGLLRDDIWHKALDRISAIEREYFLNALRQGEKLLREPRIKISTIHGAKGGEADNVVVLPDMAARTWMEFEVNPQDEHRVWYVACTRARHRLIILDPISDKFYNI